MLSMSVIAINLTQVLSAWAGVEGQLGWLQSTYDGTRFPHIWEDDDREQLGLEKKDLREKKITARS